MIDSVPNSGSDMGSRIEACQSFHRTPEPTRRIGSCSNSTKSTAMDFQYTEQCVVNMIEDDNERVKVEKNSPIVNILDDDDDDDEGVEVVISGERTTPILVDSFRQSREGSRSQPISFEDDDDEVEFLGERSAVGRDKKNAISVDEYYGTNEGEDALLRFAVAESLSWYVAHLDDPKGKKPMKVWVEVPEVEVIVAIKETGESSSQPPAEPEEYCNICMEPKFRHECFYMKGCSHYYCVSCVGSYVEAKIEDNVTSIGCPDPSCKDGFLEPEMCQLILKPEVFSRWGNALCEAMIGEKKFYCPFKDCSALLIDEGEGDCGLPVVEAECPHCCRLFCARCKVPWHVVSCEEYQKLGVDERAREDIMLREMAKSCQWQRCPKCKYYVERISGCMFMKCRCGHTFCYGCATTMTVDHYCTKCKR